MSSTNIIRLVAPRVTLSNHDSQLGVALMVRRLVFVSPLFTQPRQFPHVSSPPPRQCRECHVAQAIGVFSYFFFAPYSPPFVR
jgi:hypothetical protein